MIRGFIRRISSQPKPIFFIVEGRKFSTITPETPISSRRISFPFSNFGLRTKLFLLRFRLMK